MKWLISIRLTPVTIVSSELFALHSLDQDAEVSSKMQTYGLSSSTYKFRKSVGFMSFRISCSIFISNTCIDLISFSNMFSAKPRLRR